MRKGLPKSRFRFELSALALERWTPNLQASAVDPATSITIYDQIGADWWTGEGTTAKRISGALRAIGDKHVTVYINSPGGDVFEGLAIYNLLREHQAGVTVKVVGGAPVPPDRSLELWMLPQGAAPRSLGVVPSTGVSRVTLPAVPEAAFANVPALAVSLEQRGGSTTGAPQGPVLYTGRVERLY